MALAALHGGGESGGEFGALYLFRAFHLTGEIVGDGLVGASLNYLGKRYFALSSLDKSNIPDILAKI